MQILPLEDQTLVKGHLLFSLNPWHDFDYAGELDKSRANRSLQVGKHVLQRGGRAHTLYGTRNIFPKVSLHT